MRAEGEAAEEAASGQGAVVAALVRSSREQVGGPAARAAEYGDALRHDRPQARGAGPGDVRHLHPGARLVPAEARTGGDPAREGRPGPPRAVPLPLLLAMATACTLHSFPVHVYTPRHAKLPGLWTLLGEVGPRARVCFAQWAMELLAWCLILLRLGTPRRFLQVYLFISFVLSMEGPGMPSSLKYICIYMIIYNNFKAGNSGGLRLLKVINDFPPFPRHRILYCIILYENLEHYFEEWRREEAGWGLDLLIGPPV